MSAIKGIGYINTLMYRHILQGTIALFIFHRSPVCIFATISPKYPKYNDPILARSDNRKMSRKFFVDIANTELKVKD
jgi:hypothetical protein